MQPRRRRTGERAYRVALRAGDDDLRLGARCATATAPAAATSAAGGPAPALLLPRAPRLGRGHRHAGARDAIHDFRAIRWARRREHLVSFAVGRRAHRRTLTILERGLGLEQVRGRSDDGRALRARHLLERRDVDDPEAA